MDQVNVRTVLLEVIAECALRDTMSSTTILNEAAGRLHLKAGPPNREKERALLTCWHGLTLGGHLAWGEDLLNAGPPWVHLTERGRETLKHLSRDPANPDGYLAYLDSKVTLDPVGRSYLTEALKTYNANCFKATAVM